ncbi:hypothetical protein C8R48DRAFT_668100 [Suillus tomentosus]|nr:hypothetical protein C8R48DRAFT_668100 [Suillus tomentosus]
MHRTSLVQVTANPDAPLPSQPVTYTLKDLLNLEGAFPIPKRQKLDPAGEVMWHESIGRIIGNTEKAAVAIAKQLNGDEFDRLTQTMLGSLIKSGDEVQDPTAEEVLESNRTVLSVFYSLSKELETAEAITNSQ